MASDERILVTVFLRHDQSKPLEEIMAHTKKEQGLPISVAVVDYRHRPAADGFAALVRAESAGADVTVVSYHCGAEYSDAPSPGLDAFLDRLAACGATVVYGHHPHVLQAPRFVRAGSSRRLVLPSMGNFISGQAEYLDPVTGLLTRKGFLLRLNQLALPRWRNCREK